MSTETHPIGTSERRGEKPRPSGAPAGGEVASLTEACTRLARVAARLSGTQAAVVVFRDGAHPYVTGSWGVGEALDRWGSTPLSAALSLLEGEALAVDDAAERNLLAADPLHAEHGFRSFLAVPVATGDEQVRGSLCVLAREPRTWSADDREKLEDVAAGVATEHRLHGSALRLSRAERVSTEETRDTFVDLVDGIDAVVNERDLATGEFSFVSHKAEELLGYPVQRWFEAGFWSEELLHPRDRDRVLEVLGRLSEGAEGADLEYRLCAADGRTVWIRDLVRAVPVRGGGQLLRGVMVDITEQKRNQRVLEERHRTIELLRELAMEANDATTLEEPLRLALRRLCEHTGWAVGHVHARDTEGRRMVSSDLWVVDDEARREPLVRATSEMSFAEGEGLPGRILAGGRPAWIRDLSREPDLRRSEPAEEAGLTGAFGLPVLVGREVEAVLEFFSAEPLQPDEDLVDLSTHVGTILGRVTERVKAEEARREAEEDRARREKLLDETQRLAKIGSWEWEIELDRITWSDQLFRLFGLEPDAFEPSLEAYLRLLPPQDRERAEDVIGRSMGTLEPFAFEHGVVTPDGETRTVLGLGRVVGDETGHPVRMVGTAQDITERKAAEEQERELASEQAAREQAEAAEDRVRTILESISDAFFALDRDWRFTYLNQAAEELLDRSADDLLERNLWDEFPAAVGSVFEESYRKAVDTGQPVEFEAFYEPLESWFEVRAYPSDGGLSVYFHDVTSRRRAEEALRASEARYRFLADSIPQQIWTARPDGTLDYVNRVVEDYFGVDGEAIVGAGWQEVVHPEDLDRTRRSWEESLESGDPYEVDFRLRDAEDEYRWHLARARAQKDDDGRPVKWFGTNTDVHDQKLAEEARDRAMEDLERMTHLLSSERSNLEAQARELRRTARALKKSNEDLDRFAYVASHDLKAPLRGIANLSEWLADDLGDDLDDETREYIDLLQGRVHRMEALIDGILQYSRAGRSREEPEDIDVGELVRDVIDMLDPPEHFQVALDGWWPVIRTERTPLQQVFLNLVGNALKHADGEDPRVAIGVSDEGEGWYEFSVSDNGPGIDPEYHDRIFTIFQTLKARDEVEGTGIGLSVVKRTVEHHGGQVWVESRPDEGATFRFLWPMTPQDREGGLG